MRYYRSGEIFFKVVISQKLSHRNISICFHKNLSEQRNDVTKNTSKKNLTLTCKTTIPKLY